MTNGLQTLKSSTVSPIARLLKEYIDFVADIKNKRKTFVFC